LLVVDGAGYSSCKATCGDGRKVDIEKCDDGNRKNGDGCSADCAIEDGWSCGGGTSVKPSICTQNIPTKTTI
jgi:cysteine-rich repeat protein